MKVTIFLFFMAALTLGSSVNAFSPLLLVNPLTGGRDTINIIWLCGFTIFLYTWIALRLGVPTGDLIEAKTLLRKAFWTTMSVVFPEIMLKQAIEENREATRLAVDFNTIYHLTISDRQAFYILGGGIRVRLPDGRKGSPISLLLTDPGVAHEVHRQLPSDDTLCQQERCWAMVFAAPQAVIFTGSLVARHLAGVTVSLLEILTSVQIMMTTISLVIWLNKTDSFKTVTVVIWNNPLQTTSPISHERLSTGNSLMACLRDDYLCQIRTAAHTNGIRAFQGCYIFFGAQFFVVYLLTLYHGLRSPLGVRHIWTGLAITFLFLNPILFRLGYQTTQPIINNPGSWVFRYRRILTLSIIYFTARVCFVVLVVANFQKGSTGIHEQLPWYDHLLLQEA